MRSNRLANRPSGRAGELVESLGLEPHPEGGWYREVWRAPAEHGRAASTHIHFLLAAGEISRWHRVADADEIWHFYEGGPLALEMVSRDLVTRRSIVLGPLEGGHRRYDVVERGWWQAARPLGGWALVGCTVAPGFELGGFEMLDADRERASALVGAWPEAAGWL